MARTSLFCFRPFLAFSGVLVFVTLGMAPPPLVAQDPVSKNSQTVLAEKFFDDYYQQYLILFPLEATAIGDNRYIALVDATQLESSDQLSIEILKYELQMRLDGLKLRAERIPASQFDGLHLSFAQMGSGTGSHPFKSVKDYDDWLQRMEAFALWSRVAQEQFKRGAADGYVLPKLLVEKMIPQLSDDGIVGSDLDKSLFYQLWLNLASYRCEGVDNLVRRFKNEELRVVTKKGKEACQVPLITHLLFYAFHFSPNS